MQGVVSNSTPLIYLAKIGKLELLRELFGEVLIPKAVYAEVVLKGESLGLKDAYVVEAAVTQGWIKVIAADPLEMPIELDKGEEEALCLAKRKNMTVLIDEVSARSAARLLSLTPRGTIFVLLLALKEKKIVLDEFMQVLNELIDAGFRLKEEVYVLAIKEATKLARDL